MNTVFKASLLYVFAALAVTAIYTHDPLATIDGLFRAASSFSGMMGGMLTKLWPVLILALVFLGPRRSLDRIAPIIFVGAAAFFLQVGFLFAKSAIPQMIPFYADEALARMDRALLFGHDAWSLAHRITPDSWVAMFPTLYMPVWAVAAIAFPVIVVVTDPDEARMTRYVWLFFTCWVLIGNAAATLGSSVGPIYYDRLLETDRYAELHAALQASGFAQSSLGQLQESLWTSRSAEATLQISSISAFPSMHVAVATLVALYLWERAPKLAVFGFAFLAMITLISVYSGYHYLLDSLVGAAMVWGLARGFRWYAARRAGAAGALPDMAKADPVT